MTGCRLVAFAGIGSLAALQWASLLAEPPTLRLLGVAGIGTLLGWLLSRIAPGSPWRRGATTVALATVATAGALLLLEAPVGDLMPSGWERLTAGVDEGLTGLGGAFDYPFGGTGEWARLLIVVAIVPLTVAASVLSFRPGRDPDRAPVAGLIALIVAFSIPAVARPTAVPLLWGGALLALVAVWLWGGSVRVVPALAIVGGFGVAAVPVATGLAAAGPAVDYESWALPGVERSITFEWEPSYGPIDWPRTGLVLFRVHAERPSFWRVGVLDEFHVDGWRRSGTGGPPAPAEPAPSVAPVYDPGRTRSAWFSIRALESPLLISPGTSLAFQGVDGSDRDRDGTTHVEEQPLHAGSSYSVLAWAPDPGPARLRAASRRYRRPLAPYTRLALPDGAGPEAIAAAARVEVPLWGERRGVERARRRLDRSPYGRIAGLAERLTAEAGSGYEAATGIADHLRSSYAYDEDPPVRRLPLLSFLFRDRAGYCQHFAGAMALMLRMVGIPARVAVGFAPGAPTADGRGYKVTDLEAHSWVEVYFNGIGWLPFDPTPPAAPASIETRGGASFGPDTDDPDRVGIGGARLTGRGHDVSAPADGDDDGDSSVPALWILAALAGALLLVPPIRSLHHRRLAPETAGDREVAELRRALRATGWARTDSTTLLIAEDRLRRARRRAAAAYVRRFRERLYGSAQARGPTLAERRSMRRDLGTGGRLRSRLRLLVLVPPGAPRKRPRT